MNHTGVRSTASRRSAASMRSRPVMAVAVPLTAASVDPDVEGRCLVAAAIGADREVGVGADDPGKAGDALGHQSGKGIEVGDADHRDEVRRSRRGVDLRDAVDVGQGSAQAADRPRLADDEKEGGEHPAMVLTHPATPARRPTAASRDVGVTTRDGGRRREHEASQMDEQLVCINCWKWYDGRTVCPTCKTPLVHPGTGQAPADSVPPAASAQPAAGPAWPVAPAPLPAESGYGGPPLPVSGYPTGTPLTPPTRLETRDYLAGNPSGAPTPLLQERLAPVPPAPPAWEPAPLPPPDVEPTPPARPEPEAAPTVPTWGLRQRREEAPTPPDVVSPETVSPSPAPYPPSTPAPVPPPPPAPAPAPPPVPADTASTADDGYSAPPAQDRYPAAPPPDRYSAAPAEGRYAAPASAPDQHSAAPAEDWDSAVPAEDDSFRSDMPPPLLRRISIPPLLRRTGIPRFLRRMTPSLLRDRISTRHPRFRGTTIRPPQHRPPRRGHLSRPRRQAPDRWPPAWPRPRRRQPSKPPSRRSCPGWPPSFLARVPPGRSRRLRSDRDLSRGALPAPRWLGQRPSRGQSAHPPRAAC